MTDAPTSPGGGGGGSPESGSPRSGGSVREQDRFLPIANISRIMKKAIPPNGKIAKDAKETVQDCVSEFISFITSEASKKCQREKRKTINGDDLLWAMATLGFEDYIEPLKVYLQKYRESVDHPNIGIEQSVNTSVVRRGADNSVERRGLLPKNPSEKKRYNNRKRYLAMTSKEQQAYLERNRQYKRDRKNQYSSNLLNQCIPVQKQSHEDYDSSIYIPTDHFPAVQDKFEQANNMTESEDEDDDINILGERDKSVDGIDYISYREQNHYISDMQDDPYDYIYQNLPSAHHYLKPVPNCSHCNAKRFQYEKPTFCCMGGNVKIVTPDIPHEMYRLYTSQDLDAKYFRDNIRYFNSHFSFTSLGVILDQKYCNNKSGIYTFRAQGQIYHRIDQLVPSEDGPKHLQLYFYDTDVNLQHRFHYSPNLDRDLIKKLSSILSSTNPYAQTFRSLGSVPTLDEYRIELNTDISLDQRIYNAPTASQVAAIWVEGNDPQGHFDRSIMVYGKSDTPQYIKAYHGC